MQIEDFCVAMKKLGLTQAQQAVAILWFVDKDNPGAERNPGDLARQLRDAGLCSPHSTRLGEAVWKTGHVLKSRNGNLKIKPASRATVQEWVATIVNAPPDVDQDNGYLPEAVWLGTRSYIEKIARQINGCYQFGFYDGAAVLVRRVIETLLIECYEHLRIDGKIKRSDGNYPMLAELIKGAVDNGHLSLGRESKKVLKDTKTVGDRSAHNRRYTAVKADLDNIKYGVRLVLDELMHLSELK